MIEKNFNEYSIKQNLGVKNLITNIFNIDKDEDLGNAAIYHQFPFYIDEMGEKIFTTDVLFVSQNKGIIVFKCIEYLERNQLNLKIDLDSLTELDNYLYTKLLRNSRNLRKGRDLKVKITPVIYLNNYESESELPDLKEFVSVYTLQQVKELIETNQDNPLTSDEFKDVKATIEGSKGLSKPVERIIPKKEQDDKLSKGAILNQIENTINNFDIEQKRAALFLIDGPQRIRGLAGSGKTIILAMKAALIHLQNPNANILYTYYTKSLQDVVKRYITRFYRQFAENDPNWDKIRIMHGWGGFGLEGVYYNTCINNNLPTVKFTDAKLKRPENPFDYVCEELNNYNLKPEYDYTLIDEAQDFPKNFYRICRQITSNNRIVWAYDDFQNILNIDIQDEKETFGKDANDNYYINFAARQNDEFNDIILHKCYRNPRKVLLSAFAIGLGIYNIDKKSGKTKIVQRLQDNSHWENLGFTVEQGNSNIGDNMIISRSLESTPEIKNEYLEESTIIVHKAQNFSDECIKICKDILNDIKNEDLKPEDITVISLDDRNSKTYFSTISKILEQNGIKCFSLLDAPNDNTTYKVQNHVTLSTIYKAKGNEAGSVYILGVDAVLSDKDNITQRNKLFTAMTRSLAWVTISGIGPNMEFCINELNQLIENGYKLAFVQPSEDEVNTIRQDTGKKQALRNRMERITDEFKKEFGDMSNEEIIKELTSTLNDK